MLRLDKLHAYYGKSHVLQGVDLQVRAGEIVSLLGRNGAGRSTVLKAVMGQVHAHGSILFQGRQLLGLPTFQIARAGLGYVPEERAIFTHLTVEQNLLMGEKGGSAPKRWRAADMFRMFAPLEQRKHVAAGLLSGGEQQMLCLCRTLMGNPQLILVDEPTEGLAPQLVEQVATFLQDLSRLGIAILLVEQKLAIALEISKRVYLMGHGQVVFEGSAGDLLAHPDLQREWLQV